MGWKADIAAIHLTSIMHPMNKPLIALILVLDVLLLLAWCGWVYLKKPSEIASAWTFKGLVFGSAIALARAWGADWEITVVIALAVAGISSAPKSDMIRASLITRDKQD
jgi:hypothetical protein